MATVAAGGLSTGRVEIAAMKVVLELQDQPSNIKRVTVRHDIVIGRGAECNLRLSAPQVSRRHCFLRVSADSASITDLESSNGTFLDGQRIAAAKRYVLKDGMSIGVGPIRFVARVQSESAVVAADFLKIEASDRSLLADQIDPVPGQTCPSQAATSDPTIGDSASHPPDRMNLAVEHAGLSAEEDEPTAGYDSDSHGSSDRRRSDMPRDRMPDALDSELEIVGLGRQAAARATEVGFEVDDESETIADAEEFAGGTNPPLEKFADIEVLDELEIVEEVELIDEAGAMDDAESAEDVEDLEIVDLADDDAVQDVVAEDVATGTWFQSDSDESPSIDSDDELNDFLRSLPS